MLLGKIFVTFRLPSPVPNVDKNLFGCFMPEFFRDFGSSDFNPIPDKRFVLIFGVVVLLGLIMLFTFVFDDGFACWFINGLIDTFLLSTIPISTFR